MYTQDKIVSLMPRHDHLPWVTDTDNLFTSSPTPTTRLRPVEDEDDDEDDDQYGPPKYTGPWSRPTPIPRPSRVVVFWLVDSFVTSTITSTYTQRTPYPYPSTFTTTTVVANDPLSSTTSTSRLGGGPTGDTTGKQPSTNEPIFIQPFTAVLGVGFIGLVVIYCMRRRQKRKQIAATQTQTQTPEMNLPLSRAPSYTTHASVGMRPPPPVMLGPIPTGAVSNWRTGLDTSEDEFLRNDRTGLGNPFADVNSLEETPPPSYKSRSLASGTTSLRNFRSSTSISSQYYHTQNGQAPQDLFGDPPEDEAMSDLFADSQLDDPVSDISGPTWSRGQDGMSVVSDRSYQHDPEIRRGTS